MKLTVKLKRTFFIQSGFSVEILKIMVKLQCEKA